MKIINLSDLTPSQQEAVREWEWQNNPTGAEYEYADNHRYARVDCPDEVAGYEDVRGRGCCGSCDVELDTPDGKIMYGFNYGH